MTYPRLLISLPFCCGLLIAIASAGQYGQYQPPNRPPANQQNQQQNQQLNQPPAGGAFDPRPQDPSQGGQGAGNQQINQQQNNQQNQNQPQGGSAGSMSTFPPQGGSLIHPNPDAPPLGFDIRPRLSPVRRTSSLVGMSVMLNGTAGTPYGTVTDLVFNDNGCTQYLLVSHDGRLLLVPWKAAPSATTPGA